MSTVKSARMFLITWFLLGSVAIATEGVKDPEPIELPGQVNIALLLDLHNRGSRQENPCGDLKSAALQELSAGMWAVQLLNNQSESGATKIGIVIYDTCQSTDIALRHIHKIIQKEEPLENWNCSKKNEVPLLGVIAVGERNVIVPVANLLNAFSIPLVIASSSGADSLSKVNNVLYTAPEMSSQVTPVVGILKAFQWRLVRVISSSFSALQQFQISTQEVGIRITHQIQVIDGHFDNIDLDYLLEKPIVWPLVVVTFLDPEELKYLSTKVSHHPTKHLLWVVASPSLDRNSLPDYVQFLGPGIFVEPHSPEMAGFQQFHSSLLMGQEMLEKNSELLLEYKSTNSCRTNNGSLTCHQKPYHQVPGMAHVTEAVSALAAGLRIVTLDNCHQAANCSSLQRPLARTLLGALHKLSFSFVRNQPPELQGSRLHFTDSGRLVTVHSHVMFFNSSQSPSLIGWFSEELGVSLVSLPGSFMRTQLDSTEYQHMWAERVAASYNQSSFLSSPNEDTYDIFVQHLSHGASVRRAWAAAVLALGCVGVLATGYILIYLLLRSCNHQSTSVMMILDFALLFSIALLYAICVLFVLPPSEILCRWRLIAHSTGHTFCYSILLIQAMALKSQAKLGLGGSLSHPVIWMMLILAVAPQVTVTFQWLMMINSLTKLSAFSSSLRCSIPNTVFITLHAPTMALLLFIIIFSIPFSCNHQPNRTEIRWIFLASIVCVPVWIGWGIVTSSASSELQEPAACAHLLTIATVIVLSIFVPKMKAISQQMASFRHKKLNSPTSASTVFSLPQEHPSICFSGKSLRSATVMTNSAENSIQSPVYETFNRRLMNIPEKNDK